MLEKLTAAWRARRVLLIGEADVQALYTEALLLALGARPARIPPDARAQTLNRALCTGRISAVIIPSAHALAQEGSLSAQLSVLHLILSELREAGVPLCILCSHEDVYAPGGDAWQAEEPAPLGGRTREGLYQAILQLYADGFSRGLLGDPVSTLICRQAPCLGSTHEHVRQYAAWCRAILHGDAPVIEHPAAQGTFLHPLDAALGALCLGAGALEGEAGFTGSFNIAPGTQNLCANRSACTFLTASEGCTRAAQETHPPRSTPSSPLCGAKLRQLCGYSPMLNARQALSFLMEHERALAVSDSAAQIKRREQAEQFLSILA